MPSHDQNWTIPIGMEAVLQHSDKRLSNQERRPVVHKASDLLGSGFAPYATEIPDANDDRAILNGLWWIDQRGDIMRHVPGDDDGDVDPLTYGQQFVMQSIGALGVGGIQVLWCFADANNMVDLPPVGMWFRAFHVGPAGVAFYFDWRPVTFT